MEMNLFAVENLRPNLMQERPEKRLRRNTRAENRREDARPRADADVRAKADADARARADADVRPKAEDVNVLSDVRKKSLVDRQG